MFKLVSHYQVVSNDGVFCLISRHLNFSKELYNPAKCNRKVSVNALSQYRDMKRLHVVTFQSHPFPHNRVFVSLKPLPLPLPYELFCL